MYVAQERSTSGPRSAHDESTSKHRWLLRSLMTYTPSSSVLFFHHTADSFACGWWCHVHLTSLLQTLWSIHMLPTKIMKTNINTAQRLQTPKPKQSNETKLSDKHGIPSSPHAQFHGDSWERRKQSTSSPSTMWSSPLPVLRSPADRAFR